MSKHLIKILSIVCFVVLIPVIIIAVALCVTETTKFKVNVELKCEENANANVKVLINDKESLSASFTKNSDVTITFLPTGYALQGVYTGKATSDLTEENKIADTLSYTFKIDKDTDLVGAFNNLSININYTGFMEDGLTNVKDHVAEIAGVKEYKYGDALYDLSANKVNVDSTVRFNGWVLTTGTNDKVYQNANFNESGNFEVKASWSNQMQVTFFAADGITPIKTLLYTEQDYINNGSKINLLTFNEVKESIAKGYSFEGWKNRLGVTIDPANPNIAFATDKKIDIILQVKMIDYKLNIKKASFDDTTSVLTYDVNKGFGDYSETRKFYNFTGLKLNDIVYTYVAATETEKADFVNIANDEAQTKTKTKLSDHITAQSSTVINDVEAVWVCEYPQIDFVVTAMSSDKKFVYAEKEGEVQGTLLGHSTTGETQFYDLTADEAAFKLENNPINEFYTEYGNPKSFYKINIDGTDTARVPVTLTSILIYYTDVLSIKIESGNLLNKLTVAACMDYVLSEISESEVSSYKFVDEQALKLTFIYA